jgi:hypothetical protein
MEKQKNLKQSKFHSPILWAEPVPPLGFHISGNGSLTKNVRLTLNSLVICPSQSILQQVLVLVPKYVLNLCCPFPSNTSIPLCTEPPGLVTQNLFQPAASLLASFSPLQPQSASLLLQAELLTSLSPPPSS